MTERRDHKARQRLGSLARHAVLRTMQAVNDVRRLRLERFRRVPTAPTTP